MLSAGAMKNSCCSWLVLVVFAFSLGDVVLGKAPPAECVQKEIVGEWVFHVGENGYNNTLNCTEFGVNGTGKSINDIVP